MGTTARRGAGALAGVLRVAGLAIVAVIVIYIALTLLDANPENAFATFVREAAEFFDLGLANLFLPADPKVSVTLNYGVAAGLWYLITAVVVRLVRRIS